MEEDDNAFQVRGLLRSGDLRPIPDPTLLTSRLVREAVEDLKGFLLSRIESIEKALAALQSVEQRLYAQLVSEWRYELGMVKEIVDGKFTTIHTQIRERDGHVKVAAMNVKDQIRTAIAAQEKLGNEQSTSFTHASQKSEDTFTKQIAGLDGKITIVTDLVKATMTREEIGQLFRTVSDKIDGVGGLAIRFETMSARMEAIAARHAVREDQLRTTTQGNQWLVGAIVGGIALVVTIIALVVNLSTHTTVRP